MYSLHRRDRLTSVWCYPIAKDSKLARQIFAYSPSLVLATTQEPQRTLLANQMALYVPPINDPLLHAFFHNIWQYETINQLSEALAGGPGPCSVRWRTQGGKLTPKPNEFLIQTLEFRMLQGTLHADHIWKWASICERLVIFARDSSAEVFSDAIRVLRRRQTPDSLGLDKADLAWFGSRQNNGHFEYPGGDQVIWAQPFMVRGHGDTHTGEV